MATTTFVDGQTPIVAAWLNDVNNAVYNPAAAIIPASSIVNRPAGNIASTDVQAALNELDTEKQPLNTLLTNLAGQTTAANKIQGYSGAATPSLYTVGTATGDIPLWDSLLLNSRNPQGAVYSVVVGDRGKLIDATTGTWALTMNPATLGANFAFAVKNSGTGVITLTPSSGTIDGAATVALNAGESCFVFCDGTNFETVGRTSTNQVISYTGTGGVATEGGALSVTAAIPLDNTIPQNTEGSPILDVTITPSRAGAVIEVFSVLQVGNGSASTQMAYIVSLFQDSGANAIASASTTLTQTWAGGSLVLLKRITAPNTTPITFKVRGGPSTGGNPLLVNTTYNGTLGGTIISYIKASEVA